MLQGHIDTVPIEDPALWTTNPAGEIRHGVVYGRGAADMKGGVASFIAALDAIEFAGIKIKGDVLVATTVGEEDGGLGALSLVLRGHRADGIVITEPTELKVIVAHGDHWFSGSRSPGVVHMVPSATMVFPPSRSSSRSFRIYSSGNRNATTR